MDIENEIKKVFFDVFPNITDKNYGLDIEQNDYLNWDSFAHLELMTGAESKFQIKISPEDSLSIKTARDLLELVKSRI